MADQEDLMPESIIKRWLTFSKKPSFLEESYGKVTVRIGLLLFAALLFKFIVSGARLEFGWAIVALCFSLLVSLLLMIALDYLTEVYGTGRLFVFGMGLAVLAALVMMLPML